MLGATEAFLEIVTRHKTALNTTLKILFSTKKTEKLRRDSIRFSFE